MGSLRGLRGHVRVLSFLFIFCFWLSSAWAGCDDDVAAEKEVSDRIESLKQLIAQEPELQSHLSSWEKYLELSQDPAFAEAFPRLEVARVLSEPRMPYYAEVLAEVMEQVPKLGVVASVRRTLREKVPKATIAGRIKALKSHGKGWGTRVLGDLTLDEVHLLFYGKDHLHPSPESLLGKYLAESGAATVTRSFPIVHGGEEQGPQRLVVAISAASYPVYAKYFKRQEWLLNWGHAYIAQSGLVYSYTHAAAEFQLPNTAYTVFPHTLLKTTEAQRANAFLRAMVKYNNGNNYGVHPIMQPWLLPGYCSPGTYNNCTHWIGNMPIGDDLVDEYAFPGNVDADPNAAPIRTALQKHTFADPLVQRVWDSPGHKQFADVIGQGEQNLSGNFANPGWVMVSLLGPADPRRVPVVFAVVPDHTAPIPADFVPHYEQPQ